MLDRRPDVACYTDFRDQAHVAEAHEQPYHGHRHRGFGPEPRGGEDAVLAHIDGFGANAVHEVSEHYAG